MEEREIESKGGPRFSMICTKRSNGEQPGQVPRRFARADEGEVQAVGPEKIAGPIRIGTPLIPARPRSILLSELGGPASHQEILDQMTG